MGMNATVVVLLDSLNQIEDDPTFGKKLVDGILTKASNRDFDGTVSANGFVNAAKVIGVHHADCVSMNLVGGNTGVAIPGFYTRRGNYTQNEIEVIKAILEDNGYEVRRKRGRPGFLVEGSLSKKEKK